MTCYIVYYGLVGMVWIDLASMLRCMVWLGGPRMVYSMAWRASHGTCIMVWPDGPSMGYGMA